MTSYQRRKQHWAIDRCRTLARRGWNDEQIAKDTGLPIINVRALTLGIKRHAEQAHEEHQAEDRQDGQGDSRDDSPETVPTAEDRSA